jgi:hypothetical protein
MADAIRRPGQSRTWAALAHGAARGHCGRSIVPGVAPGGRLQFANPPLAGWHAVPALA